MINMTTIKTKNKATKISFEFAPFLFIALAIFTALGSSNGTWV
tara:strand:+ start:335 stop:463 length:129 start_codon:yes stop_codon:yes gene_type:complete